MTLSVGIVAESNTNQPNIVPEELYIVFLYAKEKHLLQAPNLNFRYWKYYQNKDKLTI